MLSILADTLMTATRMDEAPKTFTNHEEYSLHRQTEKRHRKHLRQELDIAFLQRW